MRLSEAGGGRKLMGRFKNTRTVSEMMEREKGSCSSMLRGGGRRREEERLKVVYKGGKRREVRTKMIRK